MRANCRVPCPRLCGDMSENPMPPQIRGHGARRHRRLVAAVFAVGLMGGCQSMESTFRPILPDSVGNFVFSDSKPKANMTQAGAPRN